jgi:hypothetical protein
VLEDFLILDKLRFFEYFLIQFVADVQGLWVWDVSVDVAIDVTILGLIRVLTGIVTILGVTEVIIILMQMDSPVVTI